MRIIALNDYASFILCQNVFHTIIENKSASLITGEQLTRVVVCISVSSHSEGNLIQEIILTEELMIQLSNSITFMTICNYAL